MGENTGSLISRSPEFSREEKCVNRKLQFIVVRVITEAQKRKE